MSSPEARSAAAAATTPPTKSEAPPVGAASLAASLPCGGASRRPQAVASSRADDQPATVVFVLRPGCVSTGAASSGVAATSRDGTLKPRNPYKMSRIGMSRLKKQYGKYDAVDTPSTPEMYAPHVFQGTSTDVTVPESSTARDSTSGAIPRRANSFRYIRAGRTSATYWSPAMTFRPMPLRFTARMSPP